MECLRNGGPLGRRGRAAPAAAWPGGDGAGAKMVYPQSAVAVGDGTGSSTWWYVVIATMVVFGLTLAGAAIIRRTDRRRQLAGLAH